MMKINYCPNCGQAVQRESRFCHNCGADFARLFGFRGEELPRGDFKQDLSRFIEDFIENNSDILKDLAASVEKGEPLGKIIKSGDMEDLEKLLKDTSFYPFFHHMAADKKARRIEFKEATAEVTKSEHERKIKVRLPGTTSMDDVMINKIRDGLEIAGRGKDVVYFSKVKLEGDFEIKDKRLEEEVLTFTVT
jgi:hypothetical protein